MADRLAGLVGGGAVVHLPVAGEQWNGERHPPGGGDHERSARAGHSGPSEQARPTENERDAYDERHGGADIAPCVAMRGNAVHALVGGGVDQHGVIEGE